MAEVRRLDWAEELAESCARSGCAFLAGCVSGSDAPQLGGRLVCLVRFEPDDPPTRETEVEEGGSETWEPVVPDADLAYTTEQMAQAWQRLSRPLAEDDAALSVDPDDYPLF
ncbi:MAG: hypothetical protein L0Z62_31900 [Gemmataceae bacterium]|nr:hypothetical protein [Gemmataceae bacterium]